MPQWRPMMLGSTSSLCCRRLPVMPRQNASEQWMSHTAFLQSCAKPKKEHASLKPKHIIFETVPLEPKNGSSVLKVSSSRLSFKTSETSSLIVRSVFNLSSAFVDRATSKAILFGRKLCRK